MNKRLLSTLLVVLMTGFLWIPIACTRMVTPAQYKGRQLVMGSGGGITGFVTTYYLLDNRRLFVRNGRDTMFTSLDRQSGLITRQLFRMVEDTCNIKGTTFDHPGNLYKFVQWKKGEQSYKVSWGDGGETVPVSYPRLYRSFMAVVPSITIPDK